MKFCQQKKKNTKISWTNRNKHIFPTVTQLILPKHFAHNLYVCFLCWKNALRECYFRVCVLKENAQTNQGFENNLCIDRYKWLTWIFSFLGQCLEEEEILKKQVNINKNRNKITGCTVLQIRPIKRGNTFCMRITEWNQNQTKFYKLPLNREDGSFSIL